MNSISASTAYFVVLKLFSMATGSTAFKQHKQQCTKSVIERNRDFTYCGSKLLEIQLRLYDFLFVTMISQPPDSLKRIRYCI